MIDDHNRCEWVNVSSGTGLPGLSWTSLESRKMVVLVAPQKSASADHCMHLQIIST